MTHYEKTALKPQEFVRLYGISYGLFEVLLSKVADYIKGQSKLIQLVKEAESLPSG